MKATRFITLLSFFTLAIPPVSLADTIGGTISGDYVESRTAEVFAGPCISNSEVNLTGDQAILGWRVNRGAWEGVSVDGLGVMAVVKAKGTIGDPYENPYPAKAVLVVDERATAEQRQALVHFAQSKGGELLENVVAVEAAAIHFVEREHGSVVMTGGDIVRIETRNMTEADHLCGNAELCYLPITKLAHSMPVFTLDNKFSGKGLGVQWRLADKSSSFAGTFAY